MMASATVRRGICRGLLRTDFMPANGNRENPSASGANGQPEKDPPLRCLVVAGLNGECDRVAALPAGIVAGEKVAVAPGGRPVALKVSTLG